MPITLRKYHQIDVYIYQCEDQTSFHYTILSEVHLNICSRCVKQATFSGQQNIGGTMVKQCHFLAFKASVEAYHLNSVYLFIYTIFQEGDIFSSTASLPYGPLNI